MVLDRLSKAGLDPWISSEIRPGQRFRTEIRQRIRSADLVIAIFASDPSHWLTAEAGLAYFEEKLIPVAIDQANVVEPFSELQAHTLFSEDIDAGGGPSVDSLIDRVRTRLGHNVQHPLLNDLFRISNAAFFAGVPILGAALVCLLLLAGVGFEYEQGGRSLWQAVLSADVEHVKGGHIVLGAIVFGGAAFMSLISPRAATSRSLAERHFAMKIAKHLFTIWILVAVTQFILGIILVARTDWDLSHNWVSMSIICYILSIFMFVVGFFCHQMASGAGEEDYSTGATVRYAF
jgi:uncharacterized membrane protein